VRSNGKVAPGAGAAALSFPCFKCNRVFKTEGWRKWHYCKEHCTYSEGKAATAASDPDKYIKGRYGHMVQR